MSKENSHEMRARSTGDVPLEALRELRLDLSPDIPFEVDERQIQFRAADPPSYVTFLAEAVDWIKWLGVFGGAVFAKKFMEEAAKDTWKYLSKQLSAMTKADLRIKKLAAGIAKFRQKVSPKTSIGIALPIPGDHFATRLVLIGSDADDLALQIALFVHHLPALTTLIQSEGLEEGRVLGAIQLKLIQDASLDVSWTDEDFKLQRRVLPLKGVAK